MTTAPATVFRAAIAAILRQVGGVLPAKAPGTGDLRASRVLLAHGSRLQLARGAVRAEVDALMESPKDYVDGLQLDCSDIVSRAREA